MSFNRMIASLAVVLALSAPVQAQQQRGGDDNRERGRQAEQGSGGGIFSLIPADSTTEHVFKGPSGDLPYTATAGTLDLFGQDGNRSAKIFYTAYIARNRAPGRPSPSPSTAARAPPPPICISAWSARKSWNSARPATMARHLS